MTRRDVGTTLRLLGPALQVVCLLILFTSPGDVPPGEGTGIGTRRLLLYAGFGAGLIMVLVGNILTRAIARPAPSRPFDLRLDDSEPNPGAREHG